MEQLKEEIKLLTFQPQQMSDEIKKLKDELYNNRDMIEEYHISNKKV